MHKYDELSFIESYRRGPSKGKHQKKRAEDE